MEERRDAAYKTAQCGGEVTANNEKPMMIDFDKKVNRVWKNKSIQ
jgi:hypothetical protein